MHSLRHLAAQVRFNFLLFPASPEQTSSPLPPIASCHKIVIGILRLAGRPGVRLSVCESFRFPFSVSSKRTPPVENFKPFRFSLEVRYRSISGFSPDGCIIRAFWRRFNPQIQIPWSSGVHHPPIARLLLASDSVHKRPDGGLIGVFLQRLLETLLGEKPLQAFKLT